MVRRVRWSLPLLSLLLPAVGCTPPRALADLGPEPSLAPRVSSLREEPNGEVQLDVGIEQAAYVTVLTVVRNGGVTLLTQNPETASTWLPVSTHHLRVSPLRPPPPPPAFRDQGLAHGIQQLPWTDGSLVQPCPEATIASPSYCTIPPTEPLMPVPPLPPTSYLVVIAAARGYTVDQLVHRLRDADLSADGRELVTDVALQVVDADIGWAAYAVRLGGAAYAVRR